MKKECSGGCSGKAVKESKPRKFHYDCENFAGIAKISLGLRKFRNHSEIPAPVNFVYLFLNDYVLVYYHLVPCISQCFRHSCIFTLWVDYINPHGFVTLGNFWGQLFILYKILAAFSFRVCFSLFSLLFLSFSRLPNTLFEDDNSRDAWLSLIALKMRVASLV